MRRGPLVGVRWPIQYKWSNEERVAHLMTWPVGAMRNPDFLRQVPGPSPGPTR